MLVPVLQYKILEDELALTIHSCKHIYPEQKIATSTVSNSPLNGAVINGNEGGYVEERCTEKLCCVVCLSVKMLQGRRAGSKHTGGHASALEEQLLSFIDNFLNPHR